TCDARAQPPVRSEAARSGRVGSAWRVAHTGRPGDGAVSMACALSIAPAAVPTLDELAAPYPAASKPLDIAPLGAHLQRLAMEASQDQLPELLGILEAAKAAAWVRLSMPALRAPVATEATEMLTAEQLATMFNTPKSLWYELARRGDVPCVQLGH